MKPPTPRTTKIIAPLVAALALACNDGPNAGGQTGDLSGIAEVTSPAGDLARICNTEDEAVGDVEETTDLGFSAQDVLDFAAGEHTATLHWTSSDEHQQDVEVEPERGDGEITITVTYDGGDIRYQRVVPEEPTQGEGGELEADGASTPATQPQPLVGDAEPVTKQTGEPETAPARQDAVEPASAPGTAPATTDAAIYGDCSDALEIDVEVTVTTSGGALAETFTATLVSTNGTTARLLHELDLSSLDGELTIAPGGEGEIVDLTLDAVVSEHGTVGELKAGIQVGASDDPEGSVAYGFLPLAYWPAESTCGAEFARTSEIVVPADTAVRGITAEDVQSYVNGLDATEITWHDGSTAEIRFEASAGDLACVNASSGDARYPMTVSVQTDDERISLELEMRLGPVIDGDELMWVEGEAYVEGAEALEALGLDLGEYENGQLRLAVLFDDPLSGEIVLSGYEQPECSPEVVTDPETGSLSTGGCPGVQWVELMRGAWGEYTLERDPSVDRGDPSPDVTAGSEPTKG